VISVDGSPSYPEVIGQKIDTSAPSAMSHYVTASFEKEATRGRETRRWATTRLALAGRCQAGFF
jgi:hypothetical protein